MYQCFNEDIIGYSPAAGGAEMDESGIAWETDKSRFSQVSGFKYVENNNLTTPFPLTESYCNSVLQVSSGAEYYPYDGYPNPVTYESYCFYYPDNDNVQYLYEGYPDQISPIEGVTNEHFMVWMRTAGLPTFRKLYGKIDGDFSKGDVLTFDLIANFEVDSFDASKGLVISTLGDLGGKNPFIGVAYVVVGAISLVLAALFGLKYFLDPRKQGSSEFLHWE